MNFDASKPYEMVRLTDDGVEICFDWQTFDIAFEDYFFKKHHPEAADAEAIDNLFSKIFEDVAGKCNESGEYTIIDINGRYKVVRVDEIEKIRYEAMSDEEKAAYDKEKLEKAIADKRAERDRMLQTEVDPIVMNPIRWAELSQEEQENYKAYRQYLLDIPQQPEFPEIGILKFAEWKGKAEKEEIAK